MGLFKKPAWKSMSENEAIREVKKLTNQTTLAKVAIKSKFAEVRLAAVEMLTDQAMLTKVAKSSHDLCIAAWKKPTNLEGIEFHDSVAIKEIYPRITAAKKLIDQKLAQEIYSDILTEYDTNISDIVRIEIAAYMPDKEAYQAMLADIIKNTNSDCFTLAKAIEKLTNQTLLVDIIKTDKRRFTVPSRQYHAFRTPQQKVTVSEMAKKRLDELIESK